MSSSFGTFGVAALLLILQIHNVAAAMPTGAIDVFLGDSSTMSYSYFVTQASFGAQPEMGASSNPSRVLTLPPSDNPLLCKNVTAASTLHIDGAIESIMMVGRGECTFETKAFNAQLLGAKALLVHGVLASRYTLNKTAHVNDTDYEYTVADIAFPEDKSDYDCAMGRALVPTSAISLDNPLPYNAEQNDAVLSGAPAQNLCLKNSPDKLESCPSRACLLTGKKESDGTQMEACCAWDLPVWLYLDSTFEDDVISIPAAYVTLEEGNQLLQDLSKNSQVRIVLSSRPRPTAYNLSSILIWALGVTVATLAAYLSADDYRYLIRKAIRRQERAATGGDRGPPLARGERSNEQRMAPPMEETLELTPMHAVGFVVMASGALLFLFYFKIYNVVKVMYSFGCSKAVSQVLFDPLFRKLMKKGGYRNEIVWRTGTEDFGDITIRDIIAHICGYTLGLTWIIMAFAVRHPEERPFFWIMQNVFGTCMCIMFGKVIKLNSIHVASILLIVAFFYDIFFVFITPMVFGKSVMIIVATSGGPPSADPGFCEKYPDDADCQGGDPLPMLLTIPRFFDYQGGASLLGLGDIVLPGLLLSFAARFDAAKSLLGILGGGNGAPNSYNCPERKLMGNCSLCSGGYFWPICVAYAVGLMMANAAVSIMHMGQPALLYLVPCCLGTMTFMGWRRGEIKDLWDGPKCLKAADVILFGEYQSTAHAALPTEDGMEALAVPSAEDGDEDDVALLEVKRSDQGLV
jgi:signal peptide peptidase-like protein 2B